jgi:hypothetical protein
MLGCVQKANAKTEREMNRSKSAMKAALMEKNKYDTQKMSDQFIPDKYRKLFTNIPSGFVPMPVIERHVQDTLRIVIPFIFYFPDSRLLHLMYKHEKYSLRPQDF